MSESRRNRLANEQDPYGALEESWVNEKAGDDKDGHEVRGSYAPRDPLFSLTRLTGLNSLLETGDRFVAFECCSCFICAGTMHGLLLILDAEGNVLVHGSTGGDPVVAVAVHADSSSVVYASVVKGPNGEGETNICCWRWIPDTITDFGTLSGISTISVSDSTDNDRLFSPQHGPIYCGTDGGSVIKRTRGSWLGNRDEVIFEDPQMSSMSSSAIPFWDGSLSISPLVSDRQVHAITHLQVRNGWISFSWGDVCVIVNEKTGQLTRAYRRKAAENRSGPLPRSVGCEVNDETFLLCWEDRIGVAFANSKKGSVGKLNGLFAFSRDGGGSFPATPISNSAISTPSDSPVPREVSDSLPIGFVCAGGALLGSRAVVVGYDVLRGRTLLMTLPAISVSSVANSPNLSKESTPRDDVRLDDLPMSSRVVPTAVAFPSQPAASNRSGAPLPIPIIGISVIGASGARSSPSEKERERERERDAEDESLDAPDRAKRTHVRLAASFSQYWGVAPFVLPSVGSPRMFVLTRREIFMIRSSSAVERVVAAAMSGSFGLAMSLSKQLHLPYAALEVADCSASRLWSQGKRDEAISVWVENVLPAAPRLFWERFIARLSAVGLRDRIEPFLPLNTPDLVPKEVYLDILLEKCENEDYRTLLHHISSWPVIYHTERLIPRLQECINPYLQTRRCAALSAIRCFLGLDAGNITRVDELTIPGPDARDDDIRFLFYALRRLYELKDTHVDAVLLSAEMGDPSAWDFFHAFQLWPSLWVNDPVVRAMTPRFAVAFAEEHPGEYDEMKAPERHLALCLISNGPEMGISALARACSRGDLLLRDFRAVFLSEDLDRAFMEKLLAECQRLGMELEESEEPDEPDGGTP